MTTRQVLPAGLRIVLPLAAQAVAVALLGLLITRLPDGLHLPGRGIDGWLASHRTPLLTSVSSWCSAVGSTGAVVAVTVAAVVALLAGSRLRRWREAAFLGTAVAGQALVFLLVTLCVERPRPDVVRLDASPPTSSFPSGHTGAATAVYGGLAVLALVLARGRWRVPLCMLAGTVPLLVGAARLYRGMHHPGDVLVGLLNGATALWIMWRAFLDGRTPPAGPARTTPAAVTPAAVTPPGGDGRRRAVVVYQPQLASPALLADVRSTLARYGYADPQQAATGADDPGRAAAARAVADGAELVVACGGDGTVAACAQALAGTGTALALVPCGTGNLLARNLGLPASPARALEAALEGGRRRIDLAHVAGDGLEPVHVTAMAGVGLDAAIMADTSRTMKRRLGWPAYVLPAVRHLGDRRLRLTVVLDDRPPLHRRAGMAVVGNVGSLQGGLQLLPDAVPDDGVLDLVLLHPRGIAGWPEAVARLVTGRHTSPRAGDAAPFEHFRARHIVLRTDEEAPRELDGEAVAAGRELTVRVAAGALLVCCPAAAPVPGPRDRGRAFPAGTGA